VDPTPPKGRSPARSACRSSCRAAIASSPDSTATAASISGQSRRYRRQRRELSRATGSVDSRCRWTAASRGQPGRHQRRLDGISSPLAEAWSVDGVAAAGAPISRAGSGGAADAGGEGRRRRPGASY
jgi:hypothetical protein